jgi:hypothetical protein
MVTQISGKHFHYWVFLSLVYMHSNLKRKKVQVHPCAGTEAVYRPYGPWGE